MLEPCEPRRLLSATLETEPNDAFTEADPLTLVGGVAEAVGEVSASGDVDHYRFTLDAPAGVFFQATADDGTLDSAVGLFDADGTLLTSSDDGYRLDGFALADSANTLPSFDAAGYADLPAGEYVVAVTGTGTGDTGGYGLRLEADTLYTDEPPRFESDPAAARRLVLDVDGHSTGFRVDPLLREVADVRAFDLDGDPARWSPLERRAVETLWAVVAEDFAPFDVNVTTDFAGDPPRRGGGVLDGDDFRIVVSSEPTETAASLVARGSYLDADPRARVAYLFTSAYGYTSNGSGVSGLATSLPLELGNAASATLARAAGLGQYGGFDNVPQAILMTPEALVNRERWFAGQTSIFEPPVTQQDDVAALAAVLGGRADDHAFGVGATDLGVGGLASGVIETVGDADTFAFDLTGGGVDVTLSLDAFTTNLDVSLTLRNAAGSAVASVDLPDATGGSLSASSLPAGRYTVTVTGAEVPGRLGRYDLSVIPVAQAAKPDKVRGPIQIKQRPRLFSEVRLGREDKVSGDILPKVVRGPVL